MRNFIGTATAFAFAAAAPAWPAVPATDSAATSCVRVEVRNVRPGRGPVLFAAYTSAEAFEKTERASASVAAKAATVEASLCDLDADVVAVLVYQDLNDNGKLDTGMFGIPTEPTGNSGRPARMGPPTWERSKVTIDASTIVVELSR